MTIQTKQRAEPYIGNWLRRKHGYLYNCVE
jgi:hypothetical protein